MAFLSGEDLKGRISRGNDFLEKNKDEINLLEKNPRSFYTKFIEKLEEDFIIVYPYEKERLEPISYQLSLGDQVYVTADEAPRNLRLPKSSYITIEPGEFAVLTTYEYVYVPKNLVAFISIRYGYKERGLVNVSGFHVDPGFFGKLLFTVYNAGPNDIVLKHREPLFMIMFANLTQLTDPYKGKRQAQTDVPPEVVARLHGTSISPRNLDERLKRVELWLYLLTVAVIPIFVSVLVTILGRLLG
ncbi:MAG: hypothetical protein QXI19_12460 [Candidatus Caldarchaeum sp.]